MLKRAPYTAQSGVAKFRARFMVVVFWVHMSQGHDPSIFAVLIEVLLWHSQLSFHHGMPYVPWLSRFEVEVVKSVQVLRWDRWASHR